MIYKTLKGDDLGSTLDALFDALIRPVLAFDPAGCPDLIPGRVQMWICEQDRYRTTSPIHFS